MSGKVLIVEDEAEFAALFAERQRRRVPDLSFEVCTSPREALGRLGEGWDLLIVDLGMPELDGRAFVEAALAAGVEPARIVVHSARPAEELHRCFSMGECLAVINKVDQRQQAVLDMILDNLARRVREGRR